MSTREFWKAYWRSLKEDRVGNVVVAIAVLIAIYAFCFLERT